MKLLFDQNLSPDLSINLAELFPGSIHVRAVGLRQSPDEAIWSYAAANGFVIVTKDGDFRQMSRARGAPPKVIWLRLGNCSVDYVERVLRTHSDDLWQFEMEPGAAILIIE